MALVKCKKCAYRRALQFTEPNFLCARKAPVPDTESKKAYWPFINVDTDGCGEGQEAAEKPKA